VILLDTHVWVWWVHGDVALPAGMLAALHRHERNGFAVSAISSWEVAKLVERGRLTLSMPVSSWMQLALDGSSIQLLP
jgi:PIN domain nuclease of toxin-antitoxin system